MTSQPVSAQYGRAAQKTHSDLKELSETSFLACSGMRPWFERRLLSPQIESNIVRCPDPEAAERMITAIDAVRTRGDSCGGVVTCIARGVPKVSARTLCGREIDTVGSQGRWCRILFLSLLR
jgi:hypothetical protein